MKFLKKLRLGFKVRVYSYYLDLTNDGWLCKAAFSSCGEARTVTSLGCCKGTAIRRARRKARRLYAELNS